MPRRPRMERARRKRPAPGPSRISSPVDEATEWLESDRLGGFAMGTTSLIRTRRYHALLQVATTPPTGRAVLVDGYEAWIERAGTRLALTTQYYLPDVAYPDGTSRIVRFVSDPWPTWTYRLNVGIDLEHEVFVPRGRAGVALRWRLRRPGKLRSSQEPVRLIVRPLLSGRDHHSLHRENPVYRFDAAVSGYQVRWHPYADLPAIISQANASYIHDPVWYRNFRYAEERARGLDFAGDLASPGLLAWDLTSGDAVWILSADDAIESSAGDVGVAGLFDRMRTAERRERIRPTTRLQRSASKYIVPRGAHRTILAGYPWFTDWGRDTFIAMRGLYVATGELEPARSILLGWAGLVDQGMLPNRFADRGIAAEFNAVDASLWFIVAAHDLLRSARAPHPVSTADRATLLAASEAILEGYTNGTRFGIHADDDGLLFAGSPGNAITWMDAKVDGRPITPRIGKPVEVQALWLNALHIMGEHSPRWQALYQRGMASFQHRFWHPGGYLYDVIDVDGHPGEADASFRPNQIFAIGGLPHQLLEGKQAVQVVQAVEDRLLTPLGLRTLAPEDAGYQARYEGDVVARDGSYHQGIVWPWLMGPFVEAWIRVRGSGTRVRRDARARFLPPLIAHLDQAGLGHISEIADGEAPFTPRGCPFQAWSLGEFLRLDKLVLVSRSARRR